MRRNTYLAHHGIKGQRWGVKNGPPYPLDANRHNVQERTLNGTKKTKIRSANAKKLIAAGAITAGVLLAGYGAYRLSKISPGVAGLAGAAKQSGYNEAFSAKHQISLLDHFRGIKKSDRDMDFDPSQLDPSFSHKDRYMSKKEDVDAINGALGNVNPFRTVNCTICTTAYEMRRRGYDVKANSLLNGGGPKTPLDVCGFFKNASLEDWKSLGVFHIGSDEEECRRAVKKELMSMGKGARGNFFGHLNTELTTMCHSVIFEVDDDDVHFIDAQSKKWYTYEEGIKMFKTRPGSMLDNTTGSIWLRTDDKELDFDALKNFVSDAGGKTKRSEKRSEPGRPTKREMLSKAAGAAKTVVRKVRSRANGT